MFLRQGTVASVNVHHFTQCRWWVLVLRQWRIRDDGWNDGLWLWSCLQHQQWWHTHLRQLSRRSHPQIQSEPFIVGGVLWSAILGCRCLVYLKLWFWAVNWSVRYQPVYRLQVWGIENINSNVYCNRVGIYTQCLQHVHTTHYITFACMHDVYNVQECAHTTETCDHTCCGVGILLWHLLTVSLRLSHWKSLTVSLVRPFYWRAHDVLMVPTSKI